MAARPISSGTISFGLVSIPVKLYSTADNSRSVHFHMLDPEHKVRVKQQYISSQDERVVKREDMIKGYEFAKGQFVTFSDEEIKAMSEKASPAIDITEFVPLSEIDPIYFDKLYYLGPETGAERAYRLLSQAMRQTERCAIAKYAARGKQYLVLLRPFEDGIAMQQLKYNDEIRDFAEVPLGEEGELKEGELDLAIQLIDQIANDEFEPAKYEDEVRERMLEAIQQKIDGQEITMTVEEEPRAQIIDLMDALKASLGSADDAGEETKKKRKPRRSASGSSRKKAVAK